MGEAKSLILPVFNYTYSGSTGSQVCIHEQVFAGLDSILSHCTYLSDH